LRRRAHYAGIGVAVAAGDIVEHRPNPKCNAFDFSELRRVSIMRCLVY